MEIGNNPKPRPCGALFVLAWMLIPPALGQDVENQIWPEADLFVNLRKDSRLFLMGTGTRIEEHGNTDGTFGIHFDFFTSPLFKRRFDRMSRRPDVARNTFLLVRVGYLYSQSSKNNPSPFTEHTPTAEVTNRYFFSHNVLFSSRSRGDLRFVNGAFTPRFRQRIKLERTVQLSRRTFTPYVHAEAFYDPRYKVFHQFRYGVGSEWELNKHFVLEAYYIRQRDNRSSVRFLNAAGVSLQCYLR